MKTLALALLCILSVPAVASKKHAPLPDAVYTAKTIYIVNQTGVQDAMDVAYDRFSKWGRYTIVTDKSKADLIVQFTHDSGLHQGTTIGFTQMEVLIPGADQPAFEATERFRSRIFGASSIKNCVEDFEKRVDAR